MGTDKSVLEYYGLPHREYLYNLLKQFCEKVYLSVSADSLPANFPGIIDDPKYTGIGPMAALLSAWQQEPGTAWLVIGCDYPFIDKDTIQNLIEHRGDIASCFLHPENNLREPLLTIYEAACYPMIMKAYQLNQYSLRKILESEEVITMRPPSRYTLKNVNTIEEHHEACNLITDKSFKI